MHRPKSKLVLNQIQQILSNAGYQIWATHRTRAQLVGMLTILVNQVAAATGRPVWRIYWSLLVAMQCTLKGRRFAPHVVKAMWARMPVDGGGAAGRPVVDREPERCPCCGAPLEPLDPAKSLETPRESPQSGGVEGE